MEAELLTVEPVLVVGFGPDVIVTAAPDRRTEDGSVDPHEVHGGPCVELTV